MSEPPVNSIQQLIVMMSWQQQSLELLTQAMREMQAHQIATAERINELTDNLDQVICALAEAEGDDIPTHYMDGSPIQ